MNNQVQKGDALYVPAPTGGFTSGNGYEIGSIFGVAGFTCLAGATGVLWLVGCYTLPKLIGTAWTTVGELLYWDNTNKWVTPNSNSGANLKIGIAMAVASSGAATGEVRLNGAF